MDVEKKMLKSKKIFILISIFSMLLITCTVSAKEITDEKNDIFCYKINTGANTYSISSKNVGDRPYIDIIKASYSLNGNNLTMSLSVEEQIPSFNQSSICSYVLYYGDPDNSDYWHTATYTTSGTATYQTIQGGSQNIGTISNPLSNGDKTFTASFEIQTDEPSFEFWAVTTEVVTNFDYTNIDTENPQNTDFETKTYVDAAPLGPGEWAGSMYPSASSSNDDGDNGGGSIPGFEIISLLAAIGLALIFLRKRK